jgi:lambda family phage portal protein
MYLAPDYLKYRTIPAAFMLHWFRKDRVGQVRGLSELAPGLELFALLRRFEMATVTAAEFAASLAGVMETPVPTDGKAYPTIPFDTAEFERGLLLNLPNGHKLNQLKAEHPATTFEMFEKALLRQLASSLDIPFGIAVGDHSSYNYSSGRLDNQSFLQTIRVERGQCQRQILEPVFREWLNEATKIPHLLPDGLSALPENIPHVWHWDGMPHVDPKKENEAKKINVDNNMQTLASVYAERGEDWEEALEQIAREREKQRELNIVPIVPGAAAPTIDESDLEDALDDAELEEGVPV